MNWEVYKMARRAITIDEKIEKAEAAVAAAKAKYDAALDELERLVAKRKEMDDQKVLEAYHAGGKTADEIVAFIYDGEATEELPKSRKRRLRVKK